jgi:hypothetical protein
MSEDPELFSKNEVICIFHHDESKYRDFLAIFFLTDGNGRKIFPLDSPYEINDICYLKNLYFLPHANLILPLTGLVLQYRICLLINYGIADT